MTVPLSASLRDSLALEEDCSSVRVAVRARPLVEKEIVEKCKECVSYSQDGKQVVLGRDRRFTFDHVFGPTISQDSVYIDCVKSLVESCCAGYNATVLAYGQTGAGKTFTMGCGNNVSLLEEELGILPRAIRQLYEIVEDRSNQTQFLIKCAYVEIYNEEIKDLLHPDTPSKSISIREDANGDIVLAGVKEEVVTNFESMIRFLEHGSVFRTTGSTLMNQHSSRSHAIFTIIVEQRSILESAVINDVITAKFHLVDLAGSERAKRTGAVGVRFKESVTINCGLLALGNVISALGDERKRCQHVPYRESKLTRMLQDSLGGNSRTCMIACISTADTNFEETLNTLKYANRARNIRNKPVINRDPQSLMLNQLRQEIRALQVELLNQRMRNMGLEPVNGPQSLEILLQDESHRQFLADIRVRADISVDVTAELNAVRRKSREREQECLKLKDEMQALQLLVKKLEDEMLETRTERDHFQLKLDEVNSEMMAIMQVMPHWEGGNDISSVVKGHLLEMIKRVMGEIDNGPDYGSSESSFSSLDRPPSADTASRESEKDLNLLSETEPPREYCINSAGRPGSQSEDSQIVASMRDFLSSPTKADALGLNCTSRGRTNRGTRSIINQHLRTIRALEERLAVKENDVKSKDEALKEATEDLSRDERIFAEKMKEIKALKKLARELSNEKDALLQKAERDAAVISRMSEQDLAKEDELGRLRVSLETLGYGRPDAFVMNGACVPGVPIALTNPKREHGDSHVDNSERTDEAKCDSSENATNGFDTFGQACLEDSSDKIKVGKVEMFSEKKGPIEEQKQYLEEDVRVRAPEFTRSKQVRDKQLHEFIEELSHNESEAKHLTSQSESRMVEIEAELQAVRRKSDERASAKNKLKELGILEVNPLKVNNRQRNDSFQKGGSKRGNTALPALAESPHRINVDRMEALLDEEIDKLLTMKEAKNSKDKQEAKKDEILLEKDNCLNERLKLELNHARAVHCITKELEQRKAHIEHLGLEIQEKLVKLEQAKFAGESALANELYEEVSVLHEECQHEKEKCINLEDCQSSQKILTEAEELGDLDERIEGLDAQAEYVTLSIAEHERDIMEGNSTKEEMAAQLEAISPHDAKVMLRKYLEKHIGVIDKQRQDAKILTNLEVKLKENQQALNEVERSCRLKELDFDRRLTELQTEHAKNVQHLLKQVETVLSNPALERPVNLITKTLVDFQLPDNCEARRLKDESSNEQTVPDITQRIVELDKANTYYKEINKNLKHKLRKMINAFDSEKQSAESKAEAERKVWESERAAWEARENSFLSKHEQLEEDHKTLKVELENTKSLMHKAGLGIRLSVRDVRELTDRDVEHQCLQPQQLSRGEP